METAPWANSPGSYIDGHSRITEVDLVAREMEGRWGADRLRLLVPVDLRAKFDRQRYLLNHAIWRGHADDLEREAGRMVAAWRKLDAVAKDANAPSPPAEVWEQATDDGQVMMIVRHPEHAALAQQSLGGRAGTVWTLEEIARLLTGTPTEIIKRAFPGSYVEKVRMPERDPLVGVYASGKLDDPIEDMAAFGRQGSPD